MSVVVGDITIKGAEWIDVTFKDDPRGRFLEAFPNGETLKAEVAVPVIGGSLKGDVEFNLQHHPELAAHARAIREYVTQEVVRAGNAAREVARPITKAEPEEALDNLPDEWRCKCAAMVPGEYLRCPTCGTMRGMR